MAKTHRKKVTAGELFLAVVYILIGVLFCVRRGEILTWIMIGAGVLAILLGLLDLLIYRFVRTGAVAIAAGVLLIVFGSFFATVALVILGVVVVFRCVAALINSRGSDPYPRVVQLVSLLVGVLLVVNAWVMADWFFVVIGAMLAADGAMQLVDFFRG